MVNFEYIVIIESSELPVSLETVKRHLFLAPSETFSIESLTSASTLATASTINPHDLADGEIVRVEGANEPEYNGEFSVTVTSDTGFTYLLGSASTSPATGAITATTNVENDAYLTLLVNAASGFFERYTRLTLLETVYDTFRNNFFSTCIELRRGPLLSVNSIDYLVNGVSTALPLSDAKVTQSPTFSKIFPAQNSTFPIADRFPQSVTINFTAGFGTTSDDIPDDVKIGLLNHIAAMWTDRGDCQDCSNVDQCLPNETALIYDKYKVINLNMRPVCDYACGTHSEFGYYNG